ncbi:hypothetical protein [Flavobacterium poyangense]|uniref:hypothetical protein n=1 Tax=Flavobacterium poyangense TaxID=2204302 RepID=UPI001420D223|nr:hypothetical protein [Flavobacterium sp. JXAS1]
MKIKNAIKAVFIFSIAMLTVNCETEKLAMDESAHQTKTILSAKKWFKEYESNGKNYELVQNLNYDWQEASLTESEDGTPTIVVPVLELKKDEREFWEQKLYIYKLDDNKFKALVFEAYSNKNVKPESQVVDGGDFTGYMTVWDLKTGPVRAAKFENNHLVEEGVAEFSIDRNKTGKAPPDPPCVYADFGDGGCGGLGDGESPIPLRPVIVTGPSTGTPVIYNPRPPIPTPTGGGTTPGGYTNPGGGSSNGGTPPPNATNPCNQLKGLTDVTKTGNMKPSIDWLIGKVKAAKNDKEHAIEVERRINYDATYRYDYTQISSQNEFSAPVTTGERFVGSAHSHPKKGVAMFSFQDVRLLRDTYEQAGPEIKQDTFVMVVVKDNSNKVHVYAIKVNDFNALNTKVNAKWNDPKYARYNTEEGRLDEIHKKQAVDYDESGGKLEKSFLQQFDAFGITLYEADELLTKWDKIEIDKTTKDATAVPCT